MKPPETSLRHAARRGFTLTEMLVSVAVLAVMIMAFSQIMSQAHKVISGTQISIRANSAAAAISDIIRRDLLQTNKDGFLYIKGSETESGDVLMATTTGLQHSLTGKVVALGAVAHYGLAPNQANKEGENESIFFRQCWLLPGEGEVSPDDDIWDNGSENYDLSEFTALPSGQIATLCEALAPAPTDLTIPPEKEDDLKKTWAILARKVSNLRISYATASGGTVTWTAAPTDPAAGAGIWTHEDPDDWPVLVKFTFKLDHGSFVRAGLDGADDYEIVCPVGH